MDETQDISHIKRTTVVSTLSLFFQSGYSALLGFVANIILTILLSPQIFGIYITVLSVNAILSYFSDVGLAASLVQKKEVTEDDFKTSFTVQQILVITLVLVGFIITPLIKNFYGLPQEGAYLFWALLISFFISSLKTIPSILLERKIQFQKIVFVQVIENTVFYLSVTVFAVLGFGLMSFAYSVILRSVIGLIIIYSISFWLPKIGISRANLKELLAFGVPFQASSFLALFKDDLIILFLGKILGFEGLGYIGWAKKWAEAPIRIVMDSVSRVLFPVLSRLQHDRERVSRLIEKILYYQTLLLAPAILGLAIVMEKFIMIVPKYGKWAPALPLFYLFCLSAFFSSYSTPFINLFNALGKVRISFVFMLGWTIAIWLLTPTLTKLFGLYGFPITQVILSSTFILVVLKARTIIKFDFIKPIYKSIITTLIMAGMIVPLLSVFGYSIIAFASAIAGGAVVYFTFLKLIFKINLFSEIKSLFKR
jgi:O-antigen/teichoic acid export membrane protein